MRSRLGPVMVMALGLLVLGMGAASAQPASSIPLDGRCAAWGATGIASPLGDPGRGVRVRALAQDRSCELLQVRLLETWTSPGAQQVLKAVGAKDGWTYPDPPGDRFWSDGTPVDEEVDLATDLTSVTVASVDLDKKEAARLAKRLTALSGKPGPDLVVTLPLAAGKLLKAGRYDLFLLDTAGDPTTTPVATRFYDLVFDGEPGQTVPGVFEAEPNNLPGGRWLATFVRRVVDGTVQSGAGLTDFFDPKPGPSGTDQYYNASPIFVTAIVPEGVAFLVPHRLADGAFRASARDAGRNAWDLVHAPDGPLAMLPTSGRAPGAFDVAQLGLDHTPVTQATGSFGGTAFTDQRFPSHQELALLLDPGQAAAIASLDLALDVDGQRLELPGLVPVVTPAGDRAVEVFTFGIPQYGRYRLEEATGHAADGTSTDLAEEIRRALGFGSWQVDRTPGVVGSGLLPSYLEGTPGGDVFGDALLGGAWRPATTP